MGHAFVQNLRRGHYDIAAEIPSGHQLRAAFDVLALTIRADEAPRSRCGVSREGSTQQCRPCG